MPTARTAELSDATPDAAVRCPKTVQVVVAGDEALNTGVCVVGWTAYLVEVGTFNAEGCEIISGWACERGVKQVTYCFPAMAWRIARLR
jgi:hypothetical protein